VKGRRPPERPQTPVPLSFGPLEPGYVPTRAELVVHRPLRPRARFGPPPPPRPSVPTRTRVVAHRLGLYSDLRTNIINLLMKNRRKTFTGKDILSKLKLPKHRYASARTTL
jgi:hypothetical protein